MSALPPTPSQTVGPYYSLGLPYAGDWEAVPEGTPGAVRMTGRVLDGAGAPVPDAVVEIWTGRPGGVRARGPEGSGFARCSTAPAGAYRLRFVPPAGPYVPVLVFARGLLKPVATRAYLADDPFLAAIPDGRGATLRATWTGDATLEFDVRLQGEGETVFFDYGTGG
ncbi:protocatechuate 3,4-dioxygenase subunit alpha [Actinomadura parmotrematis]|uniref:Protocatechuate 3,4-dioxygenase subunit alpha n=1 Tax=Actinomadura parmotrematis TaxID=2864039 RepID=A0ABS7FPT5_9ACTN|nr:protocatechuate 3,4-dioxygenase subunit alpha [Actinomadura parmotrematis]MBW8482405.1 protocatechuate 3,4-dioxygenase subunit alpha [Actinomadura parmotrematis]